jgi:hypothetical protein
VTIFQRCKKALAIFLLVVVVFRKRQVGMLIVRNPIKLMEVTHGYYTDT